MTDPCQENRDLPFERTPSSQHMDSATPETFRSTRHGPEWVYFETGHGRVIDDGGPPPRTSPDPVDFKPGGGDPFAGCTLSMNPQVYAELGKTILNGIPESGPLNRAEVALLLERGAQLLNAACRENSSAEGFMHVTDRLSAGLVDSTQVDMIVSLAVMSMRLTKPSTLSALCQALRAEGQLRTT